MEQFFVKVAAVLLYFYSSRKRKEFRRCHSRLARLNRKLFRAGIIGEHTYVVPGSTIVDSRTRIGKFCSIAKNVSIGTTMHPVHALTTHPFSYTGEDGDLSIPPENLIKFQNKRPVYIGNDVWIGLNAVVMDGVTIGDGAVIGAGAVVTKDIPPYAIAVGRARRASSSTGSMRRPSPGCSKPAGGTDRRKSSRNCRREMSPLRWKFWKGSMVEFQRRLPAGWGGF